MSIPSLFSLGHSPDPDDAFMFYGLAAHKIDTKGYAFQHILEDIETLNRRCTRGELHISAISIHAYASVLDRYALLPSGASMGDGYGPMIVAKPGEGLPGPSDPDAVRAWLAEHRIAIPGTMTSAALALRLFAGELDTVVVPFDQIFQALRSGQAEAGLIIHEGQLTFKTAGFELMLDLGTQWKATTGLPLPLGGNVIRKDIAPAVRREVSDILRESIRYGLEHRAAAIEHSMPLARDLDVALTDRFVGMYVNDFTLDYGETGRQAIRAFLGRAHEAGLIPSPVELEFV
jgi:1,4-dihydroxy-6-naphthoate synthase